MSFELDPGRRELIGAFTKHEGFYDDAYDALFELQVALQRLKQTNEHEVFNNAVDRIRNKYGSDALSDAREFIKSYYFTTQEVGGIAVSTTEGEQ